MLTVVAVVLAVLVSGTSPVPARQGSPVAPVPGGAQPTPYDAGRAAEAGRSAQAAEDPAPGAAVSASSELTLRFATHQVFATQYQPNTPGSVEVAVPDKCAKFAALGNSTVLRDFGCPSGYALGLDWRVVVTRTNGRSLTIPVKDVGPWNTDDNYWAAPGSSRPRRLFRDLPAGVPEAQAAFNQDYNAKPCKNLDGTPSGRVDGADQFDRCVLNPAGIDLSVAAAAQLGLGPLENANVSVTFLWERLDPVVVATASQDDGPGTPQRLGVINGCGAAYVKDGALSGPFQQQLNCGDGRAVTLGGRRTGVINSCGAAYVKDGDLAGPFHQQLNCGDARSVALSGERVGVINGCGSSYVKEGPLSGPFRQQTNCGDSLALDVSGTRVAVINGCGALYVKEPGLASPFQLLLGCGDAKGVVLSSSRVGVVNSCGAFLVKEGALNAPFQQQTGCYDTTAIAVANNRVGVINGCGGAYVKDGALSGSFRQQLNCGDARALTLATTRLGVINGCGAAYVKEGDLSQPFRQQLNCGDTRAIALSG